jgi:hypothetical protein
MKKIFLLISLISSLTFAGGFTVRNGGGLAEFNFEYALLQSPSLLKNCLVEGICHLTPKELILIQKTLKLPAASLLFVTQDEFTAAGSVITVNDILKWRADSVILVNKETLYPHDQALTVNEAMKLLLTLEIQKVDAASVSATAVQKILAGSQVISESLSMKSFGYIDNGFTFAHLQSESLLVFQDDAGAQKLNSVLEKNLECSSPQVRAQLKSLEKLRWGDLHVQGDHDLQVSASAQVHYHCADEKNHVANLDITLDLKITEGLSQDFENGDSKVRFEMKEASFETSFIGEE